MTLPPIHRAAIFGASGGLGAAIADAVQARGAEVLRFARSGSPPFDLTDEASIEAAAERAGAVDFVFVATGMLHGPGIAPEKSFAAITPEALAASFTLNALGPALIAKHMAPRLPRKGRAVFAALSARVGSIGDNRLGGWHGYRASKAALNMLIRGFAIELARRNREALAVTLHPGTVETALSAPFRGAAQKGLFTPAESAARLLAVLDGLGLEDSGGFFAHDGEAIPF